MRKNLVWVIADDRGGNASQAIGLAESLDIPYIKKDVKYNIFMKLPNFIIGKSLIGVNKSESSSLEPPYPDLVISAGRRTAPIALYIKSKSPSCKIIHIMKPTHGDKEFDLIVVPQHDKIPVNSPNIYRTIGAINKISKNLIAKNMGEFRNFYPQANFKVISLFIGLHTKQYKLSISDAEKLAQIAERMASHHAAKLYIIFNKRTPDDIKTIFYNYFSDTQSIYDPEIGGFNPYISLLGVSNFVIVTGDSISMCSEVATAGKPLYIYTPKNFNLPKHNYFIQQLFDLKIAYPLEDDISFLKEYNYERLDEASKVVKYIQENLLRD